MSGVGGVRATIGVKITAGLLLVLFVFAAVGALAFRNVDRLEENAQWVNHTHNVLSEIDGVLVALVNIETGMRGFVATGEEVFLEPYDAGLIQLEAHFDQGRTLTLDNPAQTERWDALAPKLDDILAETDRIIELRRNGGPVAGSEAVAEGLGKAIMDDIRGVLDDLAGAEEDLLVVRDADTAASVSSTKTTIVVGVAMAALAVALVATFMTRSIAGPLRSTAERARRIASGRLDVEPLALSRTDEIGDLGGSFDELVELVATLGSQARSIAQGNLSDPSLERELPGELGEAFTAMVGSLTGMVSHLKRSSDDLASAARDLEGVSTSMGQTAEQTSTEASSASSAVVEMDASIRDVSTRATEAAQVTSQAVAIARTTSETIEELGTLSTEIGNVVKVISAIAEQTNLLALNATIEAARAGEAGKGFAVVANEVKELATQTAQATKHIAGQVEAIQAATTNAVRANTEIGDTIDQINGISTAIAGAVDQQTRATSEIAASVNDVAIAADKTRSSTDETKASSTELNRMAAEVNQLVSNYS